MNIEEASSSDAFGTAGAYERIKFDIQAGALASGGRLVESALASRYGMSRTPIREALRSLEHEGWVSRGPRGMEVRGNSAGDVLDLFETRLIIEKSAARLAVDRRTELDVITVERLLGQMEQHDPTDRGRVEMNRRFHNSLWRACHNDVLFSTLDALYDRSTTLHSSTLISEERWELNMHDHTQMVEALIDRDQERAVNLVITHLTRARDFRLAGL